eukprot:998522_1
MQTTQQLPLWGSTFINIHDNTTKKFVIEPFGFMFRFSRCVWYKALVNMKKTTIITGLINDEHLNGKMVKIVEHYYTHFYVEPVGWEIDNNVKYVDVEIKNKNQIFVDMNNLQLSTTDRQDKFKMTFHYSQRFKKQALVGICFYPSIEFVGYDWSYKPAQFTYIHVDQVYDKSWQDLCYNGVGGGGRIWELYDVTPEYIFQRVSGIKFEMRIYQILEYPVDIEYVPREIEENKAKNIIKDQNEIHKLLKPLMYGPNELMNELKQELAELKQWKIEQLKKEEEEKKDVEESGFNVTEWLKKINLEKY